MTSLAVVIITKNSEATIARAIDSVVFADEIVLIDSNSTDQTVQIARLAGAKVYFRAFKSYGSQKNFGAQQAQGEWLLFLDSDEVVSAELQENIKRVLEHPKFDFYWIRIIDIFLNSHLTHLHGHNVRLFKRNKGHWNDAAVHEQVVTQNGKSLFLGDSISGVIKAPIIHHSYNRIVEYFPKMHRYTSLDARTMVHTGQHRSGRIVPVTWWLPFFLAARQWIKLLIYRKGILDGWAGFVWCALSSYYEWELGKKFLKLKSAPDQKSKNYT